jgi:hypothetical protein
MWVIVASDGSGLSKHGNGGRAFGGATLFASSVVVIFSTIARTSPSRANATSICQMDEHAMAAPVDGANEDGDGGISRGALGSAAEHK